MAKNKSPLPPELLEHVARTFHVLGDPSRLEVLQALMAGPQTVSLVVALTGKGQANVSKHLAVLAAAGMVSRTRRGTQAIYEVSDPLVFDLCNLVCGAIRAKLGRQVKTTQQLLKKV